MTEHLLRRKAVLGAMAVLIVGQLIMRGWAIYPSWFFADDYRLMLDAQAQDAPSLAHLLSPFDSQLMPGGRLIVWVVTALGPMNWGLAATITLLLQLAASCACAWMLLTLFGRRPGTVVLLALYLTSPLGMPAFMWWAASLNQLPMQISFFCTVAAVVQYLRTPTKTWLLVSAAAFVFGLLFYVKTLLLAPLLVFLALAYFASGSLRTRIGQIWRRYRAAIVVAAAFCAAYTAYYVAYVPSAVVDGEGSGKAGEVADAMLGTALPTGALGGPWQWFETTPPIVLVGAPGWSVHLSWVVIALVLVYSLLRRAGAWKGWVVIGGYALLLYVVLLITRGQLYGALAGLEFRYLTDMVCVIPPALGLVFLELRGAEDGSHDRAGSLLDWTAGSRSVVALATAIAVGGVVSSVQYVRFWHDDNASRSYVKQLQASLRAEGFVDLTSQLVPDRVMREYTQPDNRTENFVQLFDGKVRFPRDTAQLSVIDDQGSIVPAWISDGPRGVKGSVPDCGHLVREDPAVIALDGRTFDFTWWLRVGYLASQASPVVVEAGQTQVRTSVDRGLHSLYLRVDGTVDSIRISGLTTGTALCVDAVEVGQPMPGEPR